MRLDKALEQLGESLAQVQRSALMDHKTPLRNGMALSQKLDTLAQGEVEHAVIFGDLNGFKLVNDTHGHAAGDAAIERAGKLLSVMLEPFEAEAFRQSGDEFVVICHKEQLSSIRSALSGTFALNVLYHGRSKIEIRMSFGWTTARNDTPQLWLSRAEEACRIAKQRGAGVFLEWESDYSAIPEEIRSRCNSCGASFRLSVSVNHPVDKGCLWCPQCGKQASSMGE